MRNARPRMLSIGRSNISLLRLGDGPQMAAAKSTVQIVFLLRAETAFLVCSKGMNLFMVS